MFYKIFPIFFVFLFFQAAAFSKNASGETYERINVIIDANTNKPVVGAKVYVPKYNVSTKTDKQGRFNLNANFDDKAILQVEKSGYRPYSLTVDKTVTNEPMKLGIEKLSLSDVFTDGEIYHLGDNVYSNNSANCSSFKVKSIGPFYSKHVKIPKHSPDKEAIIVFGSLIGLDTKMAKEMGQNKIISVYSSPVEVFFNGEKIAEININGDNLQIPIPEKLIMSNNELVIKTGRNLFQHNYIDYDDIEFANLRIELRDRIFANKSN